jgi:hypothetical protein
MHSIWIHILFIPFREQLVRSVKTSIEPYNNLKILMIKKWIMLKLIPSHDLRKIWLKLNSFSSGVTDTLRLHLLL